MSGNNTCSRFWRGPEKTNTGINCKLMDSQGNPTPMKHNPLSQDAARNLIANGGRHYICFANPWRHNV